jgi:hypothetical protein
VRHQLERLAKELGATTVLAKPLDGAIDKKGTTTAPARSRSPGKLVARVLVGFLG